MQSARSYSVSVGCGLPNPVQPHDWPRPSLNSSSTTIPSAFIFHMKIEKFRQRVSSTLAARETDNSIPEMAMIEEDRKSTRLNSSHSQISYAVFCLKKKK